MLKKTLTIGFLSLLMCFAALLTPTAHAQTEGYTPQLNAANGLANIVSRLIVDDSRRDNDAKIIPLQGSFVHEGLNCSSRNTRGIIECTQQDLTAQCTRISIPGADISGSGSTATSGYDCRIRNASGATVQVGTPTTLRNTFTPTAVTESPFATLETTQIVTPTGEIERQNNDTFHGNECGITNPIACIMKLPGMLLVGIAFLFLYLAGLILFMAGTLFNWVVLRTVFQFGEYFGTSEGMLVAWGVMRDIANIGLLFAFVLIGIMLILNVERFGGSASAAKKAIPRLIIFAVLLNFSLFAAQAVIDVANAFGSTFTGLAGQQEECLTQATTQQGGGQSLEDCATNVGISGRIMQISGLSGIWGDGRGEDGLQTAFSNFTDQPYSYAVSLIMLSIFVLVSALVLLAGAIMLIIRVVVLSFLMITSPIGFAGMVIPGLGKVAKDWWQTLIKQSFFAPVYLLLIFVSLKMTENLMGGEASLANAVIANAGTPVAGNVQVVMVYLIVIGFMVGSLIMANKMGAMGASVATSFAAKMTVGSAGFVGRRTFGAASRRVMESTPMKTWARSNGVGSRTAMNLLNRGATSSWSLRTGMNSALGVAGLSKSAGIGTANKNVRGGIQGIEDAEVKAREAFAKNNIRQTKSEEARESELKAQESHLKSYKTHQSQEVTLRNLEEQLQQAAVARTKEIEKTKKSLEILESGTTEEIEKTKQEIEELLRTQPPVDEASRNLQQTLIAQKQQLLQNLEQALPGQVAQTKQALAALEQADTDQTKQEVEAITKLQQTVGERRKYFQDEIGRFGTDTKAVDRAIADIKKETDGYEEYDPKTRTTSFVPGVSDKSAQSVYGSNLENSGLPYPTLGKRVNKAAARKILKDIKKSERDRIVDAIEKTMKDGGEKEAPKTTEGDAK